MVTNTESCRATRSSGPPNDTAWAAEWRRHHGDLVRYVSMLLAGDVHAAEDVAQETAIRFWQHPEVLADGRPLAGWLRTVAHNLVVDRSRRRNTRPTEVALAPGADPETPDRSEEIEAQEAVAAILSPLSGRHRAAVFEVYVRDRPVTEAAHRLGIPPGTVKSRCFTALRRLRDGLPAIG